MLTSKYTRLLAATVFVTLLFALAITHRINRTNAAAKPLKSRLVRRQDQIGLKPGKEDLAILRELARPQSERELEDKIPKHVPLKIKIKAEKESKFRDLSNARWLADLEVEVTNTSNKPIYFLEFFLVLPEVITDHGPISFPIRYGRDEFIDFDTSPLPSDTPIAAGATQTFTILETFQRGWEKYRARENKPNPRKVQIVFVQLGYGDGSGFNGTDAKPYPYKRELSSAACREGPLPSDSGRGRTATQNPRSGFPALLRKLSFSPKPAEFLPVNFYLPKASNVVLEEVSVPQSGTCCPGTQCYFHKNSFYNCACQRDRGTQSVGCSDPQGQCSIDQFFNTTCDDLGVGCPETVVGPCASGTPSASPTPCEPGTCSPPAIPVDCNLGWPNVEGCPSGYIPMFGCCYPQACPSPIPTPPGCNGTLHWFSEPTCRWLCLTPVPGGGGGGGDEGGHYGEVEGGCTDYYWVWFDSYDGGQTWEPSGLVEYAGCW